MGECGYEGSGVMSMALSAPLMKSIMSCEECPREVVLDLFLARCLSACALREESRSSLSVRALKALILCLSGRFSMMSGSCWPRSCTMPDRVDSTCLEKASSVMPVAAKSA